MRLERPPSDYLVVFTAFGNQKYTHIVIACNTAHLLLPEIGQILHARPRSLIECASNAVQARGIQKIGVLASPTTIHTKLYEKSLNRRGVEVIRPNLEQQKRIENMIRLTIADKTPKASDLLSEVKMMRDQGAESVLLGCTELSIIARGALENTIDPLQEIVNQIFQHETDEKSII